MSFDVNLSITNIQEVQRENLRRINALKPSGAVGRAIKMMTVQAHRHLVAVTHRDTGSYAGSQRMEIRGAQGRLYVDPRAVNPRSRNKPVEYSVYEEARGGTHAAYERTTRYAEQTLFRRGVSMIREAVQ